MQKTKVQSAREAIGSLNALDVPSAGNNSPDPGWRLTHLGRRLGHALRRFDERVLSLMASNVEVPLALSNLAARDQVGAAHIHITRHLAVGGSRLTDLASSAGMSKQAMGDLVDQCEAWGLVRREADPHDKRARRVLFTESGLLWLEAFRSAVAQAEDEFRQAVGDDVATVVMLGLEAYSGA
ncbi:MAG: MarR family transcriptional regulator [Polaromonas sp.]